MVHSKTIPASSNSTTCSYTKGTHPKMSSLQYFNDRGAGQKLSDICHFSQAVVLGDTVKCSG